MISIEEHAKQWREQGSPWCDACKAPAVWNETFGMLHSTPEFRFGVPPHLDLTAHKVTMREWSEAV